jgi:hypothetical protein
LKSLKIKFSKLLKKLKFTFSKLTRQHSPCYRCAGQHFLSHEDGFPGAAALEKGYNRRATLLVYLNDVPEVGNYCTCSDPSIVEPHSTVGAVVLPLTGSNCCQLELLREHRSGFWLIGGASCDRRWQQTGMCDRSATSRHDSGHAYYGVGWLSLGLTPTAARLTK